MLMELRNTKHRRPEWRNGIPVTTKKGGEIGLRSASSIIQRHSGMIDLAGSDGEFSVRLVLPLA